MAKKKVEKKEEFTPQQIINQLLGTSNRKEQSERLAGILASNPIHISITAAPPGKGIAVSVGGKAPYDFLYQMLDAARNNIRQREQEALVQLGIKKGKGAEETPEEPEI
jgi:hypothetical protein